MYHYSFMYWLKTKKITFIALMVCCTVVSYLQTHSNFDTYVCTQVTRFINYKQVANNEAGLAFSLNILLERTQSINSQLKVTKKELREELSTLNAEPPKSRRIGSGFFKFLLNPIISIATGHCS